MQNRLNVNVGTASHTDADVRGLHRRIARNYLPNRNLYWHARAKFATDPMYAAVAGALAGSTAPLLDLGCGIGLLAQFLRAHGVAVDYLGVDNDEGKVAAASAAARAANLDGVRFACMDLARDFPQHRGSVTLLDVLQYLDEPERVHLLEAASACIVPDGRLVIRTGLEDGNWRTRFTRGIDRVAASVHWMNTGPRGYPTRAMLETLLARLGMRTSLYACAGRLPFNNWLIIAERA